MSTQLTNPFNTCKRSKLFVFPQYLALFGKFCYLKSVDNRRSYSISIMVNDRLISEIIIDPHYEEKHADSITDEVILALVHKLDGKIFDPDDMDEEFQYFKTEPIELDGKNYRLVWLLKENCLFIGVVNAFRRP
ncbi:MAG: hypothetical protein HY074_04170 [Deltaproteobacteria bacterium]|nr:hypothetical protein [Deltaproteobacteria bacterium]